MFIYSTYHQSRLRPTGHYQIWRCWDPASLKLKFRLRKLSRRVYHLIAIRRLLSFSFRLAFIKYDFPWRYCHWVWWRWWVIVPKFQHHAMRLVWDWGLYDCSLYEVVVTNETVLCLFKAFLYNFFMQRGFMKWSLSWNSFLDFGKNCQ